MLKEWQQTIYPSEKLKEHIGNYGLSCGVISNGVLVFDWDFRVGFNRKKEGINYVYEIFKKVYPKLADTAIVSTPHGYHFYYILEDCEGINNTSQKNGGYTKKKFSGINSTRFCKYLSGVDTRANGGYVVFPPSEVDGKKYKWINKKEILKITKKEYQQILNFFKIPESDLAKNTMRKGFVDILNGDIDIEEQTKLVKRTHKDIYEHVYWKEVFHEAYICCGLLPKDLLNGLKKFQKSFDLEKTTTQLKDQKNMDYILNGKRMTTEKYNKYFLTLTTTTNMFDEDSNILDLPGRGNILVRKDGLYLEKVYKNKQELIYVLEGGIKLDKISYETGNNNRILLTGIHDNKSFRTLPLPDLLNRLTDYMYQGNTGKDIVKRYIHYLKKTIPEYELGYILGFDGKWCLPCIEEEQKIQIITSTDKQMEAYNNTKKLPISYSYEEKEKIKSLLTKFIYLTQMNETKLSIIIGWAISAPFRHVFINKLNLFPILNCYGKKNTGKSAILKVFCVDFYGVYKEYNSSKLIDSATRFEDTLSSSSFPVFIEEVIYMPKDILSLIKEHATGSSRYFRKRSARENDFDCLKSAPLAIDCNTLVRGLMEPATNTKLLLIHFTEEEIIPMDLKWVKLKNELIKYNLFSLIYDYTKEWTDIIVKKRIDVLYKEITDFLEDEKEEIERNNPRIIQQYIIIVFGLDLFNEVFGIKFDREEIINALSRGRTTMTQSLLNEFYGFCESALMYDPEAKNPKYLNHSLRTHKSRIKGDGYLFTSNNKIDFQNYLKEKFTLEELCERLRDALIEEHKELISNHNTGKRRGIFIDKDFFRLRIFGRTKKKEIIKE